MNVSRRGRFQLPVAEESQLDYVCFVTETVQHVLVLIPLECFLIDTGDPPTPGSLMRKAQRTQRFSRHYSLTFVRFAGDAVARRSCGHSVVCASGSPGLHWETRSNTTEPCYVRNIKTNQAPSTTPHLRPPLWTAG